MSHPNKEGVWVHEGGLWLPEGEAAILRPHTKSRAAGRFEVPIECGFFSPRSWLLLSTSEGQKVSTSSSFFSMTGLSRTLQGDNELSNQKFIVGRLSGSFCPVGLREMIFRRAA